MPVHTFNDLSVVEFKFVFEFKPEFEFHSKTQTIKTNAPAWMQQQKFKPMIKF